MAPRFFGFVQVAVWLTATAAAHGQEPDVALAEKLFTEARAAKERGDRATACTKFGESLALAKRASTLIQVAGCEEAAGRLKAAAEHVQAAVEMLPAGDERLGRARAELERIRGRLPQVLLVLPARLPAEAQVTVDGAPLERAALAAPIPLDPGPHVFLVTGPGRRDARTQVTLTETQRAELSLALGERIEGVAAAQPAADPPALPRDEAPSSGSGRRTLGFVVGGVGVASLAAGIVTGILTMGKKSVVEDDCPNQRCRTQEGIDAADAGKTLSLVSTITVAVGIAGIGAGTVLVLTSPSSSSASAAVDVQWRGRF